MSKTLCLLVCENFQREVRTVVASEPLDDVSVITFPPLCNHRKNNWDVLVRIINNQESECSRIDMLGGCAIANLDELPQAFDRCHIHKLNLCFEMYTGQKMCNMYIKQGAYLLSPGWLMHWRRHLDDWGFDKQRRLFLQKPLPGWCCSIPGSTKEVLIIFVSLPIVWIVLMREYR